MRHYSERCIIMNDNIYSEIYSVISNNGIIGQSDPENIIRFLPDSSLSVKDFQGGDIIHSSQSPHISVGIILSGSATVEPIRAKENALLRILVSNDMFGVANLYCEDQPFPSIITAKSPSRVLFIDGACFRKLIENDTGALKAYLRFMSGKIVFLNKKISTLTAGSTEKKLAVFLAEHERDGVFPQSLSMSALAEMLNIGRASLYRAFDTLEKEGFVMRDGKKIIIRDKNALLNFI